MSTRTDSGMREGAPVSVAVVKSFLERPAYIRVMIEQRLREREELAALATRISPVLDGMPRMMGGGGSRVETAAIKLYEHDGRILGAVASLQDALAEVESLIDSIPDFEQRTLLYLRYVRCLPWEEIYTAMECSESKAYKVHRLAIKAAVEAYKAMRAA